MPCIIPVVCLHKIPVVYVHLTHETSGPEGSKSLANSTTRVNGAANHSWSSFVFLSHGSLFSLSHSPPKKQSQPKQNPGAIFMEKVIILYYVIRHAFWIFLVSLFCLYFLLLLLLISKHIHANLGPLESVEKSLLSATPSQKTAGCHFPLSNCVWKLKLFNDGILKFHGLWNNPPFNCVV